MATYPTLFNFQHPYSKLEDETFTTIRSIDYAKKHLFQIGSIGYITLQRNIHSLIKVESWKDMRICDMDIALLKRDVEYEGFTIQTHLDFVNGLNEILLQSGYKYANNQLTTKKRIFYLKKVNGENQDLT